MDNVESNIDTLGNQDSILDVRITDVEQDVLFNQGTIESKIIRILYRPYYQRSKKKKLVSLIGCLNASINDLTSADIGFEQRITNLEDAVSGQDIFS